MSNPASTLTLSRLELKDKVGNNKPNHKEDLFGVQKNLSGLGYLPERNTKEPDHYITKPIEDGIRSFQKDHDLKNDGWMGPKGETETAMNNHVGDILREVHHKKQQRFGGRLAQPKPVEKREESASKTVWPPKAPKQTKILKDEKERQISLLNDSPSVFYVDINPKATDQAPFYEDTNNARQTVLKNSYIIEKMAKKHGVDADLVKAIMWSEKARGHWGGLGELADHLGVSKTKYPMNINPRIWGGLLNKKNTDLNNVEDNIEAGTILIKRINDRIYDSTPAKVGSVYMFSGREKTHDYGHYVEKIYNSKSWLQK